MNYQNDSIRRQDRLLDQPEATELLRRGEYGILCMQRPEGGGYGVPLNYVCLLYTSPSPRDTR